MSTAINRWVKFFLLTFLIILLSFDYSSAVVLDNADNGQNNAPSLLNRASAALANKGSEQKEEYAPGEVIIKLKEKSSPALLYTQSYLERAVSQDNALSNIKAKYNLKDERPVFEGIHKKLKAKNLSQMQLDEKVRAKSNAVKRVPKKPEETVDLLPIYILKTGQDVLTTCEELKKDPDIEYAEPNYIMKVQMVPNDPYYHSQGGWGQPYDDLWGLKKIQCEYAWDTSQGDGVLVAVIDTGVDYNHPDLTQNIWVNQGEIPNNEIDDDGNGYIDDIRGWNFANNGSNNNPMDRYGHGTHTAGTIAAVGNNNLGVIGVAPLAKIMVLKGLGDDGSGYTSDLAACVTYAADNGADVLSNSWGGLGYNQLLTDAFHYADSKGCVCIAAAGNSNTDVLGFSPANIDTVIAVAASTQRDEKCSFSNYGYKIAVSAPGGGYENELGHGRDDLYNIISTMPDNSVLGINNPNLKVSNGYWRLAGTSMACPHVAGLAAIIKSANPLTLPTEVRGFIITGADNIDNLNPDYEAQLGSGRINAYNSLIVTLRPVLKMVGLEKDNISAGQEGHIVVSIKNEWSEAIGVTVTLSTNNPYITMRNNTALLGDISPSQEKSNSANPFTMLVDNNIPFGEVLNFDLTISCQNASDVTLIFSVGIAYFADVGQQTNLPLVDGIPMSTIMRDYDNDGYTDIYYSGWSRGELYRNCQNGSFINASTESGIGSVAMPWTQLFVDIDNDGNQDLFIIGGASDNRHNYLFLNNGDGTFTDISAGSGIENVVGLLSAIAFDYNNDGFSDIYTCYGFAKNNGNRTFIWVPNNSIGLPPSADIDPYDSQSVVFDYDNDGDQDILLAPSYYNIMLYRNNGDGTFTDVTEESRIGVSKIGYEKYIEAVAVGDYDNDGNIDVLLSSFIDFSTGLIVGGLYKNNGNGTFTNVTENAGNVGLGTCGLWWGTDFFDYDNDGDLDFYITNIGGMPVTTNTLYRNNGDGTFTNITDVAIPREVAPAGAAACIGDYDNDGALDVYAPTGWFGSSGAFLKNMIGTKNNWIRIKLVGTISNIDAIGARVYVKTGVLRQLREVHTSPVETQPLHFGLGQESSIDKMEVHWPSGIVQKLYNISANQLITITEPALSTPSDVIATASSKTQIGLIWADNSTNETGFKIERSSDGSTAWQQIGMVAANITSYTDTGLTPGTKYYYRVCAYNGSGNSDYSNIASAVTIVGNRPPVLDPIGNKTVDEGKLLEFTVKANDPDGDNVILYAKPLPQGATFENGLFKWAPTYYQAGTYTVAFSVQDNVLTTQPSTETITITVNNVNGPPLFDPIGNKTVNKGERLKFTVRAVDPDNDRIIYHIVNKPHGAHFNDKTGLFAWKPHPRQSGDFNITFIARDNNGNKDEETITITVPNRAPILEQIGNKTVKANQTLAFKLIAKDPDPKDRHLLVFYAEGLPRGAHLTRNGIFMWEIAKSQRGTCNIHFYVKDPSGATDDEVVNITVR